MAGVVGGGVVACWARSEEEKNKKIKHKKENRKVIRATRPFRSIDRQDIRFMRLRCLVSKKSPKFFGVEDGSRLGRKFESVFDRPVSSRMWKAPHFAKQGNGQSEVNTGERREGEG
jgi:hypothetical protein